MSILLRILGKKRCSARMDVCDRWIVVDEVRCYLDDGHIGHHTSGKYTWNDNKSMKTFFESNYRDLPK